MNDDPERGLVRRLVERLHLSVAERRNLPGGHARLSLVVDSVAAILREAAAGCLANVGHRAIGPEVLSDLRRYLNVHWKHPRPRPRWWASAERFLLASLTMPPYHSGMTAALTSKGPAPGLW